MIGSLARTRRAWRAWAFYILVWLTAAFIVGNGRLGIYGPSMAYDPRYNAEMTFALPLTLVLAFAGVPATGAWSPSRLVPARVLPPLCVLIAAGLAASTGLSYARLANAWPARQAGAWAGHVRSSLTALRARGIQPSILDSTVPVTVEPQNEGQYSRLSTVLPMFGEGIVVDDQSGRDPPSVIAPDGTIRLATATVQASWSGLQLMQRHLVSVAPGNAALRGGALCAVAGYDPVLITLRLGPRVNADATVLELRLAPGGGEGRLYVYLDGGTGYPAGPSQVLGIALADRILRITLAPGRLIRARVDLQPFSRVCLAGVRVTRYTAS